VRVNHKVLTTGDGTCKQGDKVLTTGDGTRKQGDFEISIITDTDTDIITDTDTDTDNTLPGRWGAGAPWTMTLPSGDDPHDSGPPSHSAAPAGHGAGA